MIAGAAHRPWALPKTRWIWAMHWLSPLFVHWPVPFETLRPRIPAALELDTFEGQAWLTAIPFRQTGSRPRYTPALPRLSNFLELNLRTYVKAGGKSGVWLLSAEAANPVVVRGARLLLDLPFYYARMSCAETNAGWRYHSRRLHRGAPPAEFAVEYHPLGPVIEIEPGTLDHWLTERYCVYTAARNGRLLRGEIHHARWPLQQVEAEIQINTLLDALNLSRPPSPPRFHYSPGVAVVAWLPKPL